MLPRSTRQSRAPRPLRPALSPRSPRPPRIRLVALALIGIVGLASCTSSTEEDYTTWSFYEGDAGASHYSALTQIDRDNVQQLEIAWTYDVDDSAPGGTTPLVVDTLLYVVGDGGSIVALHAATGEERWTFPFDGRARDRGLLYWESEDRSDRRVYVSRGDYLYAIDALTGEGIASFGADGQTGRTDVRQGIVQDTTRIRATPVAPGIVFENLVILGSGPGENYGSGPGDIRAFDARTGELAWIFHTIPLPGEFGYDTWEDPESWKKAGGANAWGGISVDADRGIAYVPLGSATYDFYAADRLGANLFANAIVALDARTGERLWHFQTTHHDLWDYDIAATPTLLTVEHEGTSVDAVAVAAKTGYLFVFDRVTGEPLWEIEEVAFPPSEMPGEEAWPTQQIPTYPEPFAVQSFTVDDINPYLPQTEQDSLRRYVASMENDGLYTPPSTTPTMQMPGNGGGANWGSTAAEPDAGRFYVMTKNVPTVLTLVAEGADADNGGASAVVGSRLYAANCELCHGAELEGNPPLIPSLVDVNQGLSAENITQVIREGRGTMPGFPDLSVEQINALQLYLMDPEAAAAEANASDAASAAGSAADEAASGDGITRYRTGYGYFAASIGWARKPPWMTLTAYDLNTGEISWQSPVGVVDELAERGITDTGARSIRGGPSVTAGGLVFVAANDALRAYDTETGEELLVLDAPVPIEGVPAVYEVGGRQYVAVGTGSPDDDSPDDRRAYVAFALPDGP